MTTQTETTALLRDGERLNEVEEMLKACPHAIITWTDDEDMEDTHGMLPVGYSIRIRGCSELNVSAPTLREAIDLLKSEPDADGNVDAHLSRAESKERQKVSEEFPFCVHGRDAWADDCGMCDGEGTDLAMIPQPNKVCRCGTLNQYHTAICPFYVPRNEASKEQPNAAPQEGETRLARAVRLARGSSEPPRAMVGFAAPAQSAGGLTHPQTDTLLKKWQDYGFDTNGGVPYDEYVELVGLCKSMESMALRSAPAAQQDVLRAVIEMVRGSPEYDEGGPFAEMMDQALAGEVPTLLTAASYLSHGLKPPAAQPEAEALADELLKRSFALEDWLREYYGSGHSIRCIEAADTIAALRRR